MNLRLNKAVEEEADKIIFLCLDGGDGKHKLVRLPAVEVQILTLLLFAL